MMTKMLPFFMSSILRENKGFSKVRRACDKHACGYAQGACWAFADFDITMKVL